MSADTIQAQYEELEQLAKRFQTQAEANQQLLQTVRQRADALRDGWKGIGSEAFQREMEAVTYPAMNRLTNALTEGSNVTTQIARLMKQAEEDAAAPFRQNGGTGIPLALSGTPDGAGGSATLNRARQGQPTTLPGLVNTILDRIHIDVKKGIAEFVQKRGKAVGKYDPGLDLTVGFGESAIWGDPKKEGWAFGVGEFKAGAMVSAKNGILFGAGGEFYAVKGHWDTVLFGDKSNGITGSLEVKGLGGEFLFGTQMRDGKFEGGRSIEGVVGAVGFGIGKNIAGQNVTVMGEIGLKKGAGFAITKGRPKIVLPFISIHPKISKAIE